MVREADLRENNSGAVAAPTGWELLRLFKRLEDQVDRNHDAVMTAIATGYSRDFIDTVDEELRRRVQLLEQHNMTSQLQAETARSGTRTAVIVAGLASVLSFVGNLSLFFVHH